VTLAVAGLLALWFVLALDYARIRVAREGNRGMARVYLGALGFVARHLVATYSIAILALVVAGMLLVAYVAHETVWSASTWAAIAVLVAVQQAIVLARAGVRVGQVSAEQCYFGRVTPAPSRVTIPDVATTPPASGPASEAPAAEAPSQSIPGDMPHA
jgi:hypothetical protein